MLEKDFLKFYKRNLKFTNKVHSKLTNEKRLQEKYNKIYFIYINIFRNETRRRNKSQKKEHKF